MTVAPGAALPLVLASASPARLGVLRAGGLDPTVVVSGVDEGDVDHLDVHAATVELARRKATAVADRLGRGARIVVGCDTLVEAGGQRRGKPTDLDQARAWWAAMAGGVVKVVTGHWVLTPAGPAGLASSTTVHVGRPDPVELDAYLGTGEPLAVAGALTIDGYGAPFVERLDGDHGTVLGLSMPVLRHLLGELGIALTDLWIAR